MEIKIPKLGTKNKTQVNKEKPKKVAVKKQKVSKQTAKQKRQQTKQKRKTFKVYVTVLRNDVPHNMTFNITAVTREQAQSIFNANTYPKLQRKYGTVQIRAITEESHIKLRKMKIGVLANFCTHFGIMLRSGMNIEEILESFTEDLPEFKNVAIVLQKHLASGLTLSQAMDLMGIFPDILVRKIEAGEKSGRLPEAFQGSADYYNNIQKTQGAIGKALAYPLMIAGVTIVVMIFYIIGIVPRMVDTYASLGIQLPAITMAFISIATAFANNIVLIAALLVGLYFGIRYLVTNKEQIGMAWETLMLKIPIFGKIKRNQELYNFSYTFKELYSSGLLPNDALFGAEQVTTTKLMRHYIEDVRADVEHGLPLSQAFETHYPRYKLVGDRVLISFIKNGENTNLEELLEQYANKKAMDVQLTIDTSLSALEPLIMVFVMGVIGMIVLILYQPMLSIIPQMANQLY